MASINCISTSVIVSLPNRRMPPRYAMYWNAGVGRRAWFLCSEDLNDLVALDAHAVMRRASERRQHPCGIENDVIIVQVTLCSFWCDQLRHIEPEQLH